LVSFNPEPAATAFAYVVASAAILTARNAVAVGSGLNELCHSAAHEPIQRLPNLLFGVVEGDVFHAL
jgi:hypothetical protein